MANRFRLEQIQEFYITPTVTQHGQVPKWNNNIKRFDWVYSLLQLGDLHAEAYYGDLGKIAYDHSQTVHFSVAPGANENVLVSNGTIWTSGSVPGRHLPITLATNSGLSLSTQTLTLGTPSNITSTSNNSITTTTHTHAITPSLALIGNGSAVNQILVTGSTPFSPVWTLATNLVSLNALSFASTSFVKMTSAGVFALDTNTYLTSVSAHNLLSATHGDTTADSVVRGDIITGQGTTPKWTRLAFPGTPTNKVLQASATDIDWSTNALSIGTNASISNGNTGDVTLATDHGLSLSNQVIAMGTPSTLTPTTTNAVSTTTHTHAVTVGLGWIGNGSAINQIPLTGTNPFTPTWTTITNLVSLNNLSFVSTSFVKMTAANTFGLDTNVYVIKSGDTGLGNMYFANNSIIDVVSTVGSDVLNIGTANADVINIGYASSTVNINGIVSYQYATDLKVVDKLITLNVGGGIASGVSTGFEVEENSLIKGWFTTSGARTGFELRAPATSYSAIFLLSSLEAERTYTFPNASGTVALTTNLHNAVTLATDSGLALSTQVLNMGTPSNVTSTSTNSVTTSTHTHAITAGLGFIGNGSAASQILVTGTTPFAPTWTLATNIVSLNALTFASASFVKMSTAGTFELDTSVYLTTSTAGTTYVPYTEAISAVNLGAYDLTVNGLTVGRGGGSLSSNVAIGEETLLTNTTGQNNTAIGTWSLQQNNADYNTAIGNNSLFYNTTGSNNTAIGASSGSFAGASALVNETSNDSIYIGVDTRAKVDGDTNEIVIGNYLIGNGSNTASWGNNSITHHYFSGVLQSVSLVLRSGTEAIGTAPLKFTSGTLLTIPESGIVEFDGNYWYGTRTINLIRSKFLLEPLNDQWLSSIDYAGNTANMMKYSKDNIIEFGAPVGINSLYHVINSGFNDIVNIPVDISSADNTQHGVGITVGNTRLFSASMLATGAAGLVDTPIISMMANVGIGTTTIPSGAKLEVVGDIYGSGNISALSFTDRTPHYSGDALSELKLVSGINGEIDHATLPLFAQVHKVKELYEDVIKIEKKIDESGVETDVEVIEKVKTGEEQTTERDLGAMISVLTVAVQQLLFRIEILEKKK